MRDPTLLLAKLAILLAPAMACGADLAKGLGAYDVGDYETSLAECQPLAEEGNAAAQFCVGRLYANGFGVAMDDDLALNWYGQAAAQGHSEAQYNLGIMHANGWGVDMNDVEAGKFYKLAADQGYIPAIKSYGSLCHSGMGVEQNIVEAYMWFDIAAQLGDLNSEFKRDQVGEELSAEDLLKAQQMTKRWLNARRE